MSAGLSDQTLQPQAQRLVNQRAQRIAAFGLGGLHHSVAQRGGRGTEAIRYRLEGFQSFGGQDGLQQSEVMGFTRDVTGIDQPVQASLTKVSLISQKIGIWVGRETLADELARINEDRQRKIFVEVGKSTPCNFIKPFDIGGSHGKAHR